MANFPVATSLTRRAFGRLCGGAFVGAIGWTHGAALSAGKAVAAGEFDVTPYVHPELRPFVATIRQFGDAPLDAQSLAAARKVDFAGPALPAPAWREQMIAGPAGAPAVRVYVVGAAANGGGAARPAILHIHGGGFVMGTARSALRTAQDMATALDCVVVTVDYRLAPETRFPGSLEDNYAALKWLHQHAAELGVDPRRIALMGESAGGGHAAMLAIAARDRGEIPLVYQALVYPMLDDRTGSTREKPPQQGALIWTPAKNRYGWTSLLGVPAGSRQVPPGSVPARVADLRGLPPAFIGVGSIDLFVDEDIDYARRLIDAGVATRLEVVPGAFHGFEHVGDTMIGKQFIAALTEGLRQAFAPGGTLR
jgi:acetyl esterase/lipase